MANPKLTLGLDIGSPSIKLVQLKEVVQRGVVGYQLQAFGIKPLPPEAIIDGALMNSTAIVQAIQELVAELNIKNKNVTLAIPGHSVIIKKISLPVMSQEELDESIQTEAGQYINIDIKDVYLDTYPLPSEDDQMGQMDVMLVAAKKDMVNDYAAVVSEAGLNPVIVDIDTFAIQNCFEANYEVASGETVVLLNVGASIININIIQVARCETDGFTAFIERKVISVPVRFIVEQFYHVLLGKGSKKHPEFYFMIPVYRAEKSFKIAVAHHRELIAVGEVLLFSVQRTEFYFFAKSAEKSIHPGKH